MPSVASRSTLVTESESSRLIPRLVTNEWLLHTKRKNLQRRPRQMREGVEWCIDLTPSLPSSPSTFLTERPSLSSSPRRTPVRSPGLLLTVLSTRRDTKKRSKRERPDAHKRPRELLLVPPSRKSRPPKTKSPKSDSPRRRRL